MGQGLSRTYGFAVIGGVDVVPIVPILHRARTSWRWHMQEWKMTNTCGARYKSAYETGTNRVCEFETKTLVYDSSPCMR